MTNRSTPKGGRQLLPRLVITAAATFMVGLGTRSANATKISASVQSATDKYVIVQAD